MAINPRLSMLTPSSAAQYGIASLRGGPSLMMNRIDPNQDVNKLAVNAQNYAAQHSGMTAPRATGIWNPISSLNPQSYAQTQGHYGVPAPQALINALQTQNPQQIAQQHYGYTKSLPDLGQGFGSFMLRLAPSLLAGPVGAAYGPLAGMATGALGGGLTGGVKGALLGGLGGYGFGNIAKGLGFGGMGGSGLLSNPLVKAATKGYGFVSDVNSARRG